MLQGCGNDANSAKRPAGPSAVQVMVAAVERKSLAMRIQAIGNIEPYSTVALKARIDGQIVEVNFREGSEVRKGDILFRIDPRSFQAALDQAEANAMRDAANRDQARSQERRYQELLAKNFVSKEAYAQMRTNAETAAATAKASQAALENARLNLEHCTIRSPLAGFVGRVLLQVGNLVKANDTAALVVINQVQPVYATFAVPEQSLPVIRAQQARGALQVTAGSDAEHFLARGSLVFIDNAVDQTTGTIKMRAKFDNKDLALWPGQFVSVSVKLYDQNDAIIVPARALQTGPQGQYVYVVRPDMTAEVRKVVVSRSEGDIAVIGAGLQVDEKVVTHGQLRLNPGVRVITKPPARPS
ncbi:MAG: efflux RND transporter periplasmic adaptor subunit [Betaproteobacteria bacterium]|nr:efflux RND transporter periplasmic adaptor subunit [Betaproteobacteria bacterium]